VENPLGKRVIVLAGGKATDPLWPAISNMVGLACEALVSQGYDTEDAYILSPVSIPGTAYEHVSPTLSNLHDAIENWASQNTRDVLLYMAGAEGDEEAFPLANGEILTATDLDVWLDNLQADIPGLVTVIYDGCRSGSFLAKLTPPEDKERIVISSTSADRAALYQADGDLSFSGYFWRQVMNGATLGDAFKYARLAVEYITQNLPGGKITAELDDNGNGVGNEKTDNNLAHDYTIGTGIILIGERPVIAMVSPAQTLYDGSTSASLYAEGVTSVNAIDKVWVVVIPPNANINTSAAALSSFPTVDLIYNPATERYEGAYLDFNTNGIYCISIHARDIKGNLSWPVTTKIIQLNAPGGPIKVIVPGYLHTIALKEDGTVWAWGSNDNGLLGDGTTIDRHIPVQVDNISDVISISDRKLHIIALKKDGTVWAWGANKRGQLGDGTTNDRHVPVQTDNISDVIAISTGSYHTIALKEDGTVWGWGYNYWGQIGDGTTADRHIPVQIDNISDIISISAGFYHTVALKKDGTIWAWGANNNGQLGDGTTADRHVPVQISNISDVVSISAGDHYTIVLKEDGTVWAWGYNIYGQLGDGTTADRHIPVQIDNISDVISISAGYHYAIALKEDGTVWTWGYNGYGQLGDGTTTTRHVPVQIGNISDVISISAGWHHTTALKEDGTVWTWGVNSHGQVGDGTTTDRYIPVRVIGLSEGAIKVNIAPLASVNVDARWKADDGDWLESGTSIIIPDGPHTIKFSYLPCWEKPDDITVNINPDETKTFSITYESLLPCLPGNISDDPSVDMQDAIIALQVLSGLDVSSVIRTDYPISGVDIDGDRKVGLAEAIYILQKLVELR
jgi:alpha-tubulin suppressor-like RCC1 family protein